MSRRKRPLVESIPEIIHDGVDTVDTFEISHAVPRNTSNIQNAHNEVDDGYESDCVSVDDYIEEDFFSKKHLHRKMVTSKSTIQTSAVKKSRRVNNDKSNEKKKVEQSLTEVEFDELEIKTKYFKEIIDCHELTIERDN